MAKRLADEIPDKFGGVINREALGRYVDRIERLHVDRDAITGDIKEVYTEAKNAGFVTGIIRQIVRERRMEDAERHDHYALLDSYRAALGMLADTPLGQAAMAEVENTTRRAAPNRTNGGAKPRPFADQTVGKRPRGRPRKDAGTALADARAHLGEPAGTA
jgi:uncharacterized protein (UPF0335 family)